jgi:hypothetical protein
MHVFGQSSFRKTSKAKDAQHNKDDRFSPGHVDFSGVPVISSSFADEAFGKLFLQLGPMQFMQRVRLVNTIDTVESLINRAIEQRMKVGLSDADA